jgi:hypothetical protein
MKLDQDGAMRDLAQDYAGRERVGIREKLLPLEN